MISSLEVISAEIVKELVRIITGRLLTKDQIRRISEDQIGRYFASLLPKTETEGTTQQRVAQVHSHLTQASAIMNRISEELEERKQALSALIDDISSKEKQAQHFEQLAALSAEAANAVRRQVEESLRAELEAQSVKGRRLRQLVSFAVWLVTLISGAALGFYFGDLVAWVRAAVA